MNYKLMVKALACLLLLSIFSAATNAAVERINPATDVVYLGSFKMPSIDGYAYSGFGLTYNPKGNSNKGSIYLIQGDARNAERNKVAEISIPALVKSKNASALQSATQLHAFTNIAVNITAPGMLGNVFWAPKQGSQATDKLYWCWWDDFNVANDDYSSLGWAEPDFSNSKGAWHVGGSGDYLPNKVGKYIFFADINWGNTYLSGKYLLTGLTRGGGNLSSQGPTLYAVAPWAVGNPPANGAKLPIVTLLEYNDNYPSTLSTFPNYSTKDRWYGGAWITTDDKQAVLFVGRKGTGSNNSECYGTGAQCNDPCDSAKGYHAYPYSNQFIWYDVNDLAAVAQRTKEPYEPIPYSTWTPSERWSTGTCSQGFGGAAYDSINKRLFVIEPFVESRNGAPYPIIHAFQVGTASGSTPAAPKNLRVR